MLEILLDLFVAAMLAATIGWCRVLDKRIRILQDSRGELAELLRHFDESTTRAAESIVALQAASRKIGETIQSRVEKASYIADDLAFLIERSQKLNRETGAPRMPAFAEEEAPRPKPAAAPPKEEPAESGRSLNALQAMLEKLAARATKEEAPKAPRRMGREDEKERSRSRAEQELLEMLRDSKV